VYILCPCLAQYCSREFFGKPVRLIKSDKLFVRYVWTFISLLLYFCWYSPVIDFKKAYGSVRRGEGLVQGNQKVSVHVIITIHKVASNVQSVPRHSPDVYWHAELCSRRKCSVKHYVITVSDWNCLKYFCVFLYCNNQVHRDFLITLYNIIIDLGIPVKL
jgi:hypothetical protein